MFWVGPVVLRGPSGGSRGPPANLVEYHLNELIYHKNQVNGYRWANLKNNSVFGTF